MPTVDEFIEEKVPPRLHDVVAMVRQLMRECAPQANEKVSYGMPMWVAKWPLAWITTTKNSITLGFRAGVYFDDPYGMLKGTGKHARNVKIKTVADANTEALRNYIRQAVELDEQGE